jgi:ABC-2 type transport system permease protein
LKHFGTLTASRMSLAIRNKAFLFFSLIMPLAFFFLFAGIIGKGVPQIVAYMMGPIIAITVMGGFWGLSAGLVMYREQGILRRYRLAPITASDMLASSIAANYILTIPTLLIEMILARLLFHVPNFGNLLSLAVLVTAAIVSFASLGLVVASVTNTMQETQVICQIIWFGLIFFSGATFPLPMLPRIVQRFSVFLPATYLVTGLQKAIVQGKSFWELSVELVALAAWAVLAFFVAAQLFRWETEEKLPRNAKLWAAATIVPFLILGAWESKHGTILAQSNTIYQSLSAPSAPESNAPH